jgi:hypothetical protein
MVNRIVTVNIGVRAALCLGKMPRPLPHGIPLVAVAKGVNFLRRDRHSFSTAERAKRLLSGELGLTNKI